MTFKDYIGDVICMTVSAGLGATFYLFLKSGEEVLEALKITPEVDVSSHLLNEVAEKGEEGLVACVHGSVRALETPLKAVARPDITGVFWKHTIKEHIVAQIMGLWMNDERTLNTSSSSIPFLIMNKGIGVYINDPSKLEDIDLKIVSEKFEPANNSLADNLWGWMKGVRSTGTQQTEEMLVEGTHVLGIGRLVLKNESLQLDSAAGLPYIITTKDKKTLMQTWASPLPLLKVITFICIGTATFYSYRIIKRWWQRWRKARKRREEVRQIVEARLHRESNLNDLPESLMCVVCCDLRDVVLLPCQHVCVCGECSLKLNPRICPVCRTPIETIQPVYFS